MASPPKKLKLDDSALCDKTYEKAKELGFTEAESERCILKSLAAADREMLNENEKLEAIRFETDDALGFSTESDVIPISRKTVYVRHFYDNLFDKIWQTRKSILLGNPGISKSWFHWFIIYKFANEKENSMLGPSYCREQSPPAIIARQVGDSLFYLFFLDGSEETKGKVLKVACNPQKVLLMLPRDRTFYLIEPAASKSEPIVTGMHTVITCSPDECRYKEFQKSGACRRYMPCWTLAELKAVAADLRKIAEDPNHKYVRFLNRTEDSKVEERFDRFGGIFRHVLPQEEDKVPEAERAQDAAISSVALRDVFDVTTNIEATDTMKRNISHFLLQYKVQVTGEEAFTSFEMGFASKYTHAKMKERLKEVTWEEFRECVKGVQLMMMGGRHQRPELFELVVQQSIFRKEIKWKRYESGSWVDHEWDVTATSTLEKGKEKAQTLSPGTFYSFADSYFPLIDSVFKENGSNISSVQVTFAKSHEKPLSVFIKAFDRLSLNVERDKLKIYMVTDPRNLEDYESRSTAQYIIKPNKKDKDFDKLPKFLNAVKFIPLKIDFGPYTVVTP